MKTRVKHIMITLLVIVILVGIVVYRLFFYYPDMQIKVSGLYNEHSTVVCLNNDYYRITDGNIYNLDNQERIYKTSDKNAFIKSFGDFIWVIDNSTKNNLIALNSEGEVVKSYSLPDYTEDGSADKKLDIKI